MVFNDDDITPYGVICQHKSMLTGGCGMPYKRIRELREDTDLSQRQIAEIIHMHKTTYTRYETGEREIPFNIAILLAKHYKVSLDYIAELTDEKKMK